MMSSSPRRHAQSASRGATIALGLVWIGVVGFHLWFRNWVEATFWAAIGIATTVSSVAGLGARKRR